MSTPTAYLETARKALKLSRKGKSAVEIKTALDLPYATHAHHAVAIATLEERFEEPRLTEDELKLLIQIAQNERNAIAHGDARSPKLKYAGHWTWPRGRAAYLAYKRLGTHRRGEDDRKPGTGLGLLYPYNGYVRLTRAGWALIHALEAVQGVNDGR
ncbi:MAG: hypothetical protein KDE32_09960 [Novosphingobium sp.]|nr:hypothetical protein [Novosphingobium sp.]